MPKCDFNKVAMELYRNRTSATWVFSCKFTAYFQNIFSQEHLWVAASVCFLCHFPNTLMDVIQFFRFFWFVIISLIDKRIFL